MSPVGANRSSGRWESPLRILLGIVATVAILVYVSVALLRMSYPFELEWMEGGTLDHAQRLASGETLYAAPSIDFTAFIYPPLYFHLASLAGKVTSSGFLGARAVSFLASLAAFALIGSLVFSETRDRTAALVAVGLLAASYPLSDAWFDLARVDSLFLALILAVLLFLRREGGLGAALLAGLVATAALFTKQTTLMVLAPFVPLAVWRRNRFWATFFGTFVLLGTTASLWLDRTSQGWFGYYIFDLPGQHRIRWWMLEGYWRLDLLAHLPIALAVAAFFLFLSWRRTDDRAGTLFYVCMAAGLLGASMLSRMHSGGSVNVLLPAHAGLAILFGLGLATARRERPFGERAHALMLALCLAQFAWLVYDPRTLVPTRADREAGDSLLARIDSFEGEVLVLHHGYLPGQIGRPTTAQLMAIRDVLRGTDTGLAAALTKELTGALRSGRFEAVMVDGTWVPEGFEEALETAYERDGPLFDDDDLFWPRTGMRTRPESLWIRRDALGGVQE